MLGNAVVLGIDGDRGSTSPARGLPFVPVVPVDESGGAFEEIERPEFRDRRPSEAAARYHFVNVETAALVHADETALGVALRNLIDNAIKYSPGEPVVRVEWAVETGRVAIRVIDRGLGIPENEQAAVFRKFVRGQSSSRANVKGTGVGLAMVRRIVLAHHGQVRLESEVGRGSTFTILLPLHRPRPDGERLTA